MFKWLPAQARFVLGAIWYHLRLVWRSWVDFRDWTLGVLGAVVLLPAIAATLRLVGIEKWLTVDAVRYLSALPVWVLYSPLAVFLIGRTMGVNYGRIVDTELAKRAAEKRLEDEFEPNFRFGERYQTGVSEDPERNITEVTFNLEVTNSGADSSARWSASYRSPSFPESAVLVLHRLGRSFELGDDLVAPPSECLVTKTHEVVPRGHTIAGYVVIEVPGLRTDEFSGQTGVFAVTVEDHKKKRVSMAIVCKGPVKHHQPLHGTDVGIVTPPSSSSKP